MNHNFPWEKLAKYFADELTIEEAKKMELWIKAEPEREEQVNFIYKIWSESENLPYQVDVDEAWKNLEYEIDQRNKYPKTDIESVMEKNNQYRTWFFKDSGKAAKKLGRNVRRIALIAASVLIIITTGIFTHLTHQELQKAETAESIARKILTTADGERSVYTLSDGSRVILHAGSRIEVPLHFNTDHREVYLEGEAYFEVNHNADIPFIVHSGEAYTKVLGTKFLVRAWPDEIINIEVVVEEGKVALGEAQQLLSAAHQEVTITKNQKGILGADLRLTVSEVTNLQWHLGWIEGRLVFEDKKLSEILPLIERWYAVKIITEGSEIKERKLTAEIDYTQPMMEVLKGISLSLDLQFTREGQTITFSQADDIQKESL